MSLSDFYYSILGSILLLILYRIGLAIVSDDAYFTKAKRRKVYIYPLKCMGILVKLNSKSRCHYLETHIYYIFLMTRLTS